MFRTSFVSFDRAVACSTLRELGDELCWERLRGKEYKVHGDEAD